MDAMIGKERGDSMRKLRKATKLVLITLLVLVPASAAADGLNIFDDFSSNAGWNVFDGGGPSQIYIDTANKRLYTSINRNSGDTLWALRDVAIVTNDYELTYRFYIESSTVQSGVNFGLYGSEINLDLHKGSHHFPFHMLNISYEGINFTPRLPFCFWYDGTQLLSATSGTSLNHDQMYWVKLVKDGLDYSCEIYTDEYDTLLWGATLTAPSELNLTKVGADQTHDHFPGNSIVAYNYDMELEVDGDHESDDELDEEDGDGEDDEDGEDGEDEEEEDD